MSMEKNWKILVREIKTAQKLIHLRRVVSNSLFHFEMNTYVVWSPSFVKWRVDFPNFLEKKGTSKNIPGKRVVLVRELNLESRWVNFWYTFLAVLPFFDRKRFYQYEGEWKGRSAFFEWR